jgi:tetratricopeptide (TPR) repeat protein
LWFYTGKLLWPANLCFIYPRWQLNAGSCWQWLYPVGAAGVLLMFWLARGRIGRGPATAAFFFVGTLFPVLGFMNAYFMRYSFVCDHWVYLSSLGLIALAAGLVTRVAGHLRAPAMLCGFAAVVLCMFAFLTWRQCGIYADVETLWRDTLKKNPGAWLAHNNLGIVLWEEGGIQEAVEHCNEAVRIQPDSAEVHNNLGLALAQQGRIEEEIGQYEQALRLKPDYPEAHLNLGLALAQQGKLEEAIAHWKQALRLRPDYPEAHYNWGVALEQLGRKNYAIGQYQLALRIKPDYVEARDNLGNALLAVGRIQEAVKQYDEVVRTQPKSAEAHNNLALALAQQDRIEEAIKYYEQALWLQPDYAEAHWNLSIALSKMPGRLPEAITHLETALRLKPDLEGGQQMLEHLRELQRQSLSRNPKPLS